MRAHRAREGERVACRESDVADHREPVAKIVGQLVEVAALPRRRFEDVGTPAQGLSRGRRRRRPHIDELHLEHGWRCGDGRNHPLQLGEADLDRDAVTVGLRALVDVGGDPLAVAKAKDRFAGGALLAWIGLQGRVVDRTEDHVLDIGGRDDASALRIAA